MKTYLVVLGDIDNKHYHQMYDNLNHIGETKQILDNVFVLSTKEQYDYEEIRNMVAGKERGYCIIISTEGLRAAWNLEVPKSEYLKSFFEINHE